MTKPGDEEFNKKEENRNEWIEEGETLQKEVQLISERVKGRKETFEYLKGDNGESE